MRPETFIMQDPRSMIISINATQSVVTATFGDGSTYLLSKKAIWQWGRLQIQSRVQFDEMQKSVKSRLLQTELEATDPFALKRELKRVSQKATIQAFEQVFNQVKENQRPLQAIVRRGVVETFATAMHSLIDPAVVTEIAEKIMAEAQMKPWDTHQELLGKHQVVGIFDQTNGEKIGVAINAGDVLTMRAISISQFIEFQVCTNPLIWAKGFLSSYFGTRGLEARVRILRVISRDKDVIAKQLEQTLEDFRTGKKGILELLEKSKTIEITAEQSRTILGAFMGSYGIGEKVRDECVDEFTESNGRSLYDLSQAVSHVGWSTERFRKDAEHARRAMPLIAAAVTQIKDPAQLAQQAAAKVRA